MPRAYADKIGPVKRRRGYPDYSGLIPSIELLSSRRRGHYITESLSAHASQQGSSIQAQLNEPGSNVASTT